jgi:hypothetical protein
VTEDIVRDQAKMRLHNCDLNYRGDERQEQDNRSTGPGDARGRSGCSVYRASSSSIHDLLDAADMRLAAFAGMSS